MIDEQLDEVNPIPPQYRYKVVEISKWDVEDCGALEAVLDNYGMNGWKLSFIDGCKYVFVREG